MDEFIVARLARGMLVVVGLLLVGSLMSAQPPEKDAKPEKPEKPKLSIVLRDRHGHATPQREGTVRTGAGLTDISQPREDTVIITLTGVAVAGPHPCKASVAAMDFELNQCFDIVAADKLKTARLTMEASIIGLLRGDKHGGSAGVSNGSAAVTAGGRALGVTLLELGIEGHAVAGGDNLAINDHKGPVSVSIPTGEYHLVQGFRINAAHARTVCGTAAAAEFAPDPALDPTWISATEPFHGAVKKDFGFRVILHVEPE